MRTYSYRGSPRAIGRAFGEETREAIATLYARRVSNALDQALRFGGQTASEADLLALAERSAPLTAVYDPSGWAELEGIAEGSGLGIIRVLAMNGLTDFRDGLAWPEAWAGQADGCTSILVQGDATAHGRGLCGQTWDLATDNLPHVICVHRVPDDGPATRVLTTDGCLTLIGLNDAGIAVGTTNIRTKDARPGVNYLSILHKALRATRFEDAVDAVVSAHRAGAHYYWVMDATGRAAGIECSARRPIVRTLERGFAVHANHALEPEHAAIEGAVPGASSLARQARLEKLASEAAGRIDLGTLEGFFADTADGVNAICRDDIDGLNTNGVVVMDPAQGVMRVCHGVPSRYPWFEFHGS
jgi:isopenicillin-N N-acyltransferase-like protein